jgi:hypothetical protein
MITLIRNIKELFCRWVANLVGVGIWIIFRGCGINIIVVLIWNPFMGRN